MTPNQSNATPERHRIERRRLLQLLGAAGAAGGIGTASAQPPEQGVDELRLFSEVAVEGAREVVTEGNYIYVANGSGMSIIDSRNPGRLRTVAEVPLSEYVDGTFDIRDVKVDGDLAIAGNNADRFVDRLVQNEPLGIAVFDVADPSEPEFLSFYEPDPPAGVHNCFLDGDTAYLANRSDYVFEDEEGVGIHIIGNTGVEIVDLSDPTNPTHAGEWKLRDRFPAFAKSGASWSHDVYVQDDLLYNTYWDAGIVVLDVSEPEPQFVTQFGDEPHADIEVRPWRPEEESFQEYVSVLPADKFFGPPGNASYAQPSPDGDHLFVSYEIEPESEDAGTDDYGGIRVFDISDLQNVTQVGFIPAPEGDGRRHAFNSDVTNNRLSSAWFNGGVRVHDITDPANPDEIARYRRDGTAFWSAVQERGFIIGGVAEPYSEASDGGVVLLHDDRGAK